MQCTDAGTIVQIPCADRSGRTLYAVFLLRICKIGLKNQKSSALKIDKKIDQTFVFDPRKKSNKKIEKNVSIKKSIYDHFFFDHQKKYQPDFFRSRPIFFCVSKSDSHGSEAIAVPSCGCGEFKLEFWLRFGPSGGPKSDVVCVQSEHSFA